MESKGRPFGKIFEGRDPNWNRNINIDKKKNKRMVISPNEDENVYEDAEEIISENITTVEIETNNTDVINEINSTEDNSNEKTMILKRKSFRLDRNNKLESVAKLKSKNDETMQDYKVPRLESIKEETKDKITIEERKSKESDINNRNSDLQELSQKDKSKALINTQKNTKTSVQISDITTAMAENDRLLKKIERLEDVIIEKERENHTISTLYDELKDILIQVGRNEDLELLESLKREVSNQDKIIKKLEMNVQESEEFIERAKNSILSEVNQLFGEKSFAKQLNEPQKKTETVTIQTNNDDLTEEIEQSKEESDYRKIIRMKKQGRTIKAIANALNLSIQKVENILNSIEGDDEYAS